MQSGFKQLVIIAHTRSSLSHSDGRVHKGVAHLAPKQTISMTIMRDNKMHLLSVIGMLEILLIDLAEGFHSWDSTLSCLVWAPWNCRFPKRYQCTAASEPISPWAFSYRALWWSTE